jgi:hypothetical protein
MVAAEMADDTAEDNTSIPGTDKPHGGKVEYSAPPPPAASLPAPKEGDFDGARIGAIAQSPEMAATDNTALATLKMSTWQWNWYAENKGPVGPWKTYEMVDMDTPITATQYHAKVAAHKSTAGVGMLGYMDYGALGGLVMLPNDPRLSGRGVSAGRMSVRRGTAVGRV